MAISFDSLPFPFLESQREALLQWREAAIAKERELCLQRQARTQRLRDYVQQRLKMIEAKKQQSILQGSDPNSIANLNHKARGGVETSLLNQKAGVGGETSLLNQKAAGVGGETSLLNQKAAGVGGETSLLNQKAAGVGGETSLLNQKAAGVGGETLLLNQKAGRGGETSVLNQKAGGGGETSVLNQKARGGGETAVSDTTDLSHSQVAEKQWHTAPLPPLSETHRGDILSGRHHGTSVSVSGGHKTVSPRRRLFVAGSDRAEGPEGKKRAGHPTKDPYVLLTALARGYLTRRLLKSEKVQSLVNTVKDAGSVLASLDTPSSQQDLALKERVLTQLQVAQLTLHEIMFDLPVQEQLAYIAHSRVVQQERKLRLTQSLSGRGTRQGQGRLSSATVKAMGRRQKGTTAIGTSKPHSTGHEKTARKDRATKPSSSSSSLREGRTKATGRDSSSLMSTRVVSRPTGRVAGGALGARRTKTAKPSVKSKWK